MSDELILKRLFQVVAHGLKHKDYKHVNGKRVLYGQLVAGVGTDNLLRRFVRRESPEIFEQRKLLTQHIVTSVSKNLMDVFYKVPNNPAIREVLTYKEEMPDRENRTKELKSILGKFWGDKSWREYLADRWIRLNGLDPNTFIVFEWNAFDPNKERLQPRPFEVGCDAAIDFKLDNGVLKYLTVETQHMYDLPTAQLQSIHREAVPKPGAGKKKGKRFSCYAENQTFELIQVAPENISNLPEVNAKPGKVFQSVVAGEDVFTVRLGEAHFIFKQHTPHNLGIVPAKRAGYYPDPATNGRTFVNPTHPAEPYLLKSIKANSELDAVASTLALPQMVMQGGAKCIDDKCLDGYYQNGSACNTCHGRGVMPLAPNSLDAIILNKPRDKDDLFDLDKILKYIHPPVKIVEWQENYIEKLTQNAKKVMFMSDVFTRAEVAKTATGENLDVQNVYDTLYPFSQAFCQMGTFGIRIMAGLTELDEGLIASMTTGKDFKLKSLDSLSVDLQNALKSGNAELVKHINLDIAGIIFSDDPIQLDRYKMKQMYDPFAGRSKEEILILLASPYVSKSDKVLHASMGFLFDELELDFAKQNKNFYKLNRPDQRTAIYTKVDELLKRIEQSDPNPVLDLGD